MADWYGAARSNYFKVKDRELFDQWIGQYEVTVIQNGEYVGWLSTTDKGGIPTRWPDDINAGDDEQEISITAEIGNHLADGQVCIILEIGNEKMRYLTGAAIAICADGHREEINLDSIYEMAADHYGIDPSSITRAEY